MSYIYEITSKIVFFIFIFTFPIPLYLVFAGIMMVCERLTEKWPHVLKCIVGYGLFWGVLWWMTGFAIPESPVAAVVVLVFLGGILVSEIFGV